MRKDTIANASFVFQRPVRDPEAVVLPFYEVLLVRNGVGGGR